MGLASPFPSLVCAQPPQLSPEQQVWVAERIFANECAGEFQCLTSWNNGENFPSMGLGHFIWYPSGYDDIYVESFPALLDYFVTQGTEIPTWLEELPTNDAPWASREDFYRDFEGPRLASLRRFLAENMAIQAAFIIERQEGALLSMTAGLETNKKAAIEALYHELAVTQMPYGIFALIDYINFKGEGSSPLERYQGEGWGLLQVLERMLTTDVDSDTDLLEQFIQAAAFVLNRRVANSPPARNEQQWLPGWSNRIHSYKPRPD